MCQTAHSVRPTCCSALQSHRAGNAESAVATERALGQRLRQARCLPAHPARTQVRPIQSGGENAERGSHDEDDDRSHRHGWLPFAFREP